MYFGIARSENWKSCEKLNKGWSADEKYIVETQLGEKLLLRLADAELFDVKKAEFDTVKKYAALGFAMSQPLDFGICDDGKRVYMLLSWVQGEDLEAVLPRLSERQQYLMGRQAGEILRRIHAAPVTAQGLSARQKREKMLLQLERYEQSALRFAGDEAAVEYVKQNISFAAQKDACCTHGDFHPGNLIYMADGSLGVIDFNRWGVGDPYEEFYKLQSFGVELSTAYCMGQIDAYFENHIPLDFWQTLAVYVAHSAVHSIRWAAQFGQKDINGMVRRCKQALLDYDDFKTVIPHWYRENEHADFRIG